MGYDTIFEGQFVLDRPLAKNHHEYLNNFARVRHMKRDASKLPRDPVREAVGLPPGHEGEFYVADESLNGEHDPTNSILDHSFPPSTQPGLWCGFVPNEEGTAIVWDQGEKFYCYIGWIKYIVKNFIKPWGYNLTGNITWQGEERKDHGTIKIENNEIEIYSNSRS